MRPEERTHRALEDGTVCAQVVFSMDGASTTDTVIASVSLDSFMRILHPVRTVNPSSTHWETASSRKCLLVYRQWKDYAKIGTE